MFEERPYQTEANAAVVSEYEKGTRRMMHVMATGTGKTVVFAQLYEKIKHLLPGQMLVLAHTDELVSQNLAKMQAANPTLKIGKEMAGEYADAANDDIISGSVATLGRQGTKRLDRFRHDGLTKIVIDEAHHSTAENYGRVLDATGVLKSGSTKLLLGVTATPQRPDGKALSDIYEKIAFVYTLRQAISEKYLVPIRGFRVRTDTSLADVSKSSGDFVKSELSKTVNNLARNSQIVEQWKKMAWPRKTVAFTVDIDHAKALAAEFWAQGVPAEAVWGDDPDREMKLEAHREGKFRILCNCNLIVEGYDDPTLEAVLLARPTTSAVLFTQMIGRVTRPSPGKVDCLVIDFVDAAQSSSLITLPTLMGLQNTLDLKGRGLLEVVEEIEALQESNPSVDFTKLTDAEGLKALIESVNLFEVRFPPEVEENSELIWFKAIDGGYKMLVPKDGPERAGFMRIFENALGKWEIVGRIKEIDLHATRPSIEEAFKASDEQIRKRLSKVALSYVLRSATWHNKKITDGQRKMIARLFPYKKFDLDLMTSGQASKLISEKLGRKI